MSVDRRDPYTVILPVSATQRQIDEAKRMHPSARVILNKMLSTGAAPQLSAQRESQLLQIEDGTAWSNGGLNDEPYFRLRNALFEVHANVEKELGDFHVRGGPSQAYTESGKPYFTLANGKIKPEGEECRRVVLKPPFTVDRQVNLIHRLTNGMVEAIYFLKPLDATTVVWRRFPAVERYLVPDGLAFNCNARLVWE